MADGRFVALFLKDKEASMDFIDCLLNEHRTLRAVGARLATLLGEPCEVGWRDMQPVERGQLLNSVRGFVAALQAHEAVETQLLSPLLPQLEAHGRLAAAVADGHKVLKQAAHLLQVVAGVCDCQHVYRLRTVLTGLREELERHLVYEERMIFPALKELLSKEARDALGHRAQGMTAALAVSLRQR